VSQIMGQIMGRIFVSVGQGELTGRASVVAMQLMQTLRNLIVQQLRSRDYETFAVPDDLTVEQRTDWINRYADRGDIALELCSSDGDRGIGLHEGRIRGVGVFHIAHNDARKMQAELLLQGYLRRVPQMSNRGAIPDTQSSLGSIPFCRWTTIPAVVMTVGSLNDESDRQFIQNQQQELALGIAEGLAGWSRGAASAVADNPFVADWVDYPLIDINLNGALFDERGILHEGNAYVPFDLVDQLGLDIPFNAQVRRMTFNHTVYIRAADLRPFHIAVKWDSSTQTVYVRSQLIINARQLGQIMTPGYTSELQLMMFLKTINPEGWNAFADLPKYYREEGSLEGVNYDLAFAQMCVETQGLQFTGAMQPELNNWGGLAHNGAIAQFSSQRLGVRAHIQHLKAYGSTEPLVQAVVDPRFQFIRRGIAPMVQHLSGRWSVEVDYGAKVLNRLKQLYEFVGLM
jgi:hypothetical protein